MKFQKYVVAMPIVDTEEPTLWIYLLNNNTGWISYQESRLEDITFSKEDALATAVERKIKNNPFVKARPLSFIKMQESNLNNM